MAHTWGQLLILSLSFLVCWVGANGNEVKRIDVFTSDCEGCGMSTLGQLSIMLCGNGPEKCCIAQNLDNPLANDFNPGTLTSFTGSHLKDCEGFEMGGGFDWNFSVTIHHSGLDGGKFDFVTVYATDQIAQCYFTKFLDGNDFELGGNCKVI